jgi:hypothetical protein
MLMMRLTVGLVIALVTALSFTVSVSADPKYGCPAGEGWDLVGVDQAAQEIFPNLLPGLYPWANAGELAEFIDSTEDRNNDNMVCMKTMWGDHLNPNSHWYRVGVALLGTPTIMYLLRDNTANALGE